MAMSPAPALTANVSEIKWNCGVRCISRGLKSSPPEPAATGGTNPSGTQPSGGIFIMALAPTTSRANTMP